VRWTLGQLLDFEERCDAMIAEEDRKHPEYAMSSNYPMRAGFFRGELQTVRGRLLRAMGREEEARAFDDRAREQHERTMRELSCKTG
jgi:hypothetical protein